MSPRAASVLSAAVIFALVGFIALTITAALQFWAGIPPWWAAAPGGFLWGITGRELIDYVKRDWKDKP